MTEMVDEASKSACTTRVAGGQLGGAIDDHDRQNACLGRSEQLRADETVHMRQPGVDVRAPDAVQMVDTGRVARVPALVTSGGSSTSRHASKRGQPSRTR